MDEDPTGPRNGGNEALELVNVDSQDVNISNWTIKNAQGDVLMAFPTGTIIPGTNLPTGQHYYLEVILGSQIPSLVDDFNDASTPYSKTVFLGSDKGELIDNNSDAVVLENANGEVIDAVLFGEQEPSGPEVDKVRNGGYWVGPRINTSFAEGGIPLGDGEGMLGRNMNSNDSNNASDWRLDGGADALGETFGAENSPNRFPDIGLLMHHIQGYVNEMAAFLSTLNSVPTSPYLGINNGYYDNIDVVTSGNDYTVSADHFFKYTMLGTTTGTLSGTLSAVYIPTGGQSDSLEVNGTLTDPVNGNSLTIAIEENLSGYGTVSHTSSLNIAITWTEASGSYSYQNSATWVETWVAQDRKKITDHREYTDWSSTALKVSDATYDIQYLADGVRSTDLTLVRSEPYWAEAFGQTQQPSSNTNLSNIQFKTSINSDGEVTRDYTLWDMFIDDGTSLTKYVELDPSQQGSLTLTRTAGPIGDIVGTYDETLDLPLIVYHLGMYPESKRVTKNKVFTREFVTNPAGEEVFVDRGRVDILHDGFQRQRFDYYVDGWKLKFAAKVVQAVAAGACAVGVAATAPTVIGIFGFTAGSALAISLWVDIEKDVEKK